MKKFLISLAVIFSSAIAHAGSTSLIAIGSEAKPGETAYLGANFDDKNVLTGIYYLGADKKLTNYSLQDIKTSKVLYRKKGYDLVMMRSSSQSPAKNPTSVKLILLFQRNVFSVDTGVRVFLVSFNKHLGKYEIYDEKGRQITKAFATSHKNAIGLTVGIDEFQTQ